MSDWAFFEEEEYQEYHEAITFLTKLNQLEKKREKANRMYQRIRGRLIEIKKAETQNYRMWNRQFRPPRTSANNHSLHLELKIKEEDPNVEVRRKEHAVLMKRFRYVLFILSKAHAKLFQEFDNQLMQIRWSHYLRQLQIRQRCLQQ